ncbi:MAG: phosphoglycerate kinase [Alphaproteobacteria bacterium]|nr:phosphoglycerate kinase [Alphaproteobacteria bacterium]
MNIKNFENFKQFVNERGNKRCIIRCDLNLPSDIEDLSRVYAVKDTILSVASMGLQVILISHYKRPKPEDVDNPKFSLKQIVPSVSKVLGRDVAFEKRSIFDIEPSEITAAITLLENLRFYEGETKNDDALAQRLAQFGDVYINDAFSVSHRAHASVCAITKHLPSFAGLSMMREIEGITKATENIERPYTAIIGGAKVSTKIDVLKKLSLEADYLVIAGAMANTFLAAQGHDMKKSLIEPEQFETAREIMANAEAELILPTDFVVSPNVETDGVQCDLADIPDDCGCFDIGGKSTARITDVIDKSRTLLWNGTLGLFECANFQYSSEIVSKHVAECTQNAGLVSITGGGETIASLGEYKSDMTFVSTAGGAFLEYIAGYDLPGVMALQ